MNRYSDPTLSSFRKLYREYAGKCRSNANKIELLPFELTEEQFREITSRNCYYCGKPPLQSALKPNGRAPYIYNGIDRVDNRYGYVLSNVVACCKYCNLIKSSVSINMARKMIEFVEGENAIPFHPDLQIISS